MPATLRCPCAGPIPVALSSALAPAHLGAGSLDYCHASLSALGPYICSDIAYVPYGYCIARIIIYNNIYG